MVAALIVPQPACTCSEVTIGKLEQSVKYVQIYFAPCSSVSIVTFEHVIAGWGIVILNFKPFHANVSFFMSLENVRKPLGFEHFHGV